MRILGPHHSCFKASLAEIRCLGSIASILSIRSKPASVNPELGSKREAAGSTSRIVLLCSRSFSYKLTLVVIIKANIANTLMQACSTNSQQLQLQHKSLTNGLQENERKEIITSSKLNDEQLS